ncbi:hypothetical protein HYX11_03495 [Candidatus Woesearchaeota archaeon]|nr:hypothetical protein [Candidatus Woesearchaeota archaeon]
MNRVTKENIFEAMIQLQYFNLLNSLPYFQKNQICDIDGTPLNSQENPHSKGAYIIYDGPEILEKARSMAVRKHGFGSTLETPTQTDLLGYIKSNKDSDVTLLYNTAAQQITPLKGELKNYVEGEDLEKILKSNLPADFVEPNANSLNLDQIGTKTANAIFVPYILNKNQDAGVRTILVKRSPYGSLGMGKVAEFSKDGLTREFFLCHDQNHHGLFVNANYHIVGEVRTYSKENNKLKLKQHQFVHISQEGDIQYNMQ